MGGCPPIITGPAGKELKVKILEAKYEAKLEFPGGMGGAQ